MRPMTAKFLAFDVMVFLMSIRVSLVFIWTWVWWGAILGLKRPKKPPRAPPAKKLMTPLKGQLSKMAAI